MTITPDDKTAYVANEHTNNVSVVDIKSLKGNRPYSGRVRAGTQHHLDGPVGNPKIAFASEVAELPCSATGMSVTPVSTFQIGIGDLHTVRVRAEPPPGELYARVTMCDDVCGLDPLSSESDGDAADFLD